MADPRQLPALQRWGVPKALLTRRFWLAVAAGSALVVAGVIYWKGPALMPGGPAKVTFFLIGTGSTGGTYFPVGEALAAAISRPPGSTPCVPGEHCGVSGLIAVVKSSAGSVANVRSVSAGHLNSAFVQANVLARAFKGEGEFEGEGPRTDLRVIANLYPEAIHLVVARGAGIDTIADLNGKRVSIGAKGSGTQADARLILNGYGLKAGAVDLIEANASRSAEMILRGELDAFFMVAGAPAHSVADLAARGEVSLLPIDGEPAEQLRLNYPFYAGWRIPSGTYAGVDDVTTLSVGALWVTREETDPALVYAITQALFDPPNQAILRSAHAKGHLITAEGGVEGVPILLHPGAERYYFDTGILER